MFDLPDAKRVRREDLNDHVAEAWSHGADETIDPDLQAHLNAQIAKSLDFLDTTVTTTQEEAGARQRAASSPHNSRPRAQQRRPSSETQEQPDEDEDEDEDDVEHDGNDPSAGEFEFRLFSSRLPTKVTLEDDDAATPRQGAIVYARSPSFYLASHVPEALSSEYRVAAISGEDVLSHSHRPAWGMAYPWRVVKGVCVAHSVRGQDVCLKREVGDADRDARRRTRPGKKMRIAHRQKAHVDRERRDMEMKKAMDKEEQVKEKKKRLNRLKKLRKRAKSKGMKAGGKGDDGDDGESVEDGDEGSRDE
ncbi:hypothetical protein E4U21_001702 [Claviceps maximensis]|nr:hypothetical protein E4U21_001702 [Claviceps maximensis]